MQFNTAWRIEGNMSKRFLSFCSDGTWAQQDCDNEHKRDGMLIKMETQLQFVMKAAIVQKLII